MSNFRKSILITAAATIICFLAGFERPASAQNEPNAPPPKAKMDKCRKGEHRMRAGGPKQCMRELCDKLNLTEEQKKKVQPLLEKEAKDIHAIHSDDSLSADQKFEKVKAVKQNIKEEINKILTPEQQNKLNEIKAEAKNRIGENMKERMQRRFENMSQRLDLSDEQKSKLKTIFEKQAADIASVRNDASLEGEQKSEKLKLIKESSDEEIKKILTAEQQAKWEESKQKPRPRRSRINQEQETQQQQDK